MSWTTLVGHEAILEQFRRAVRRGRLGHAYLFVGPEGIGKRRLALHLAQSLLCTERPSDRLDPCDACLDCLHLRGGAHPDFTMVGKPAEKNELPIQSIRELLAHLSLRPARGRRRIAIVDDADLLNEEAANAFLKTLEEPGPGVVLLLIAAGVESQLQTIVSRCQIIRFSSLPIEQMTAVLGQLDPTLEEPTRRRLAAGSFGNIGRALRQTEVDWGTFAADCERRLAQLPVGGIELTQTIQRFVEEAGKESGVKRQRAQDVMHLAMDQLRGRLETAADATDVLLDAIERTELADRQVRQYLHLQLTIDAWLDDLVQLHQGKLLT